MALVSHSDIHIHIHLGWAHIQGWDGLRTSVPSSPSYVAKGQTDGLSAHPLRQQ